MKICSCCRKMSVKRLIFAVGIAAVVLVFIYRFTISAYASPSLGDGNNLVLKPDGATKINDVLPQKPSEEVVGRSRGSQKAWSFADTKGSKGKNDMISLKDIDHDKGDNEENESKPSFDIAGKKDENKRNVPVPKFDFTEPGLSWEDRVNDLVNRLTVDEAIQQSMAIYGQSTPAIKRLGIKPYQWITECLHGQYHTYGTAFPAPIGLGAAFSPDLVKNVSTMISYEVRAHWNNDVKNNTYKVFIGLTCFSPNINIMRHPLWGRNQETYGEDPYLTSELAASFVEGLQGNHNRYVRAAAGCKHFAAHNGPEKYPVHRFKFDAKVPEPDLHMTYLPQFQKCVEAGSLGLMCSYNKLNGIPACANTKLLKETARHLWGFKGYIVSDATAINNIMTEHKYRSTIPDTIASAVKAGCNLELSPGRLSIYGEMAQAIDKNLLTEKEVKDNVKPLFYTRMRLGEFDPPDMNPYNKINMSVVQSVSHREQALKAAMMSFVLLKNIRYTLPLKKMPYKKLAMFGPLINGTEWLYTAYGPFYNRDTAQTMYKWLPKLAKTFVYQPGCLQKSCKTYNKDAVEDTLKDKSIDIIVVALGSAYEGEFNDARDISPPGHSLDMLKDIVSLAAPDVIIVLVVFSGTPVDISWAVNNDRIGAILSCFLPAQTTGEAVYNTLINKGIHANPAGKLPFTWPKSLDQLPPITQYDMKGHTYRYFKEEEEPLFRFGYGLSYSKFKYSNLLVSPTTIQAGQPVTVRVIVNNTGPYEAEEVVQVYISWNDVHIPHVPWRTLVGFKRLMLLENHPVQVEFTITAKQMSVWVDEKSGFSILPVTMSVYAGGQQPTPALVKDGTVLQSSFHVSDNKTPIKDTKGKSQTKQQTNSLGIDRQNEVGEDEKLKNQGNGK